MKQELESSEGKDLKKRYYRALGRSLNGLTAKNKTKKSFGSKFGGLVR